MYLKYNVIVLKVLGMYPLEKNAKLWESCVLIFWRIFCLTGLIYFCIICAIDVYLRQDYTFQEVSINIMNSAIFLCTVMRSIYFYIYDDKVSGIVEQMNAIFKPESEMGVGKVRTMRFHDRFTRLYCVTWTFVVIFTGQFSVFLALIAYFKHEKLLPIQAWYPYNWKRTGLFEGTVISQAYLQGIMSLVYGATDMFYVCVMYLTAGQFKILDYEFKNVIFTAMRQYGIDEALLLMYSEEFGADSWRATKINEDLTELTGRDKKFGFVLEKCIAKRIRHHQKLIAYCQQIQDFFSTILLINLSFGLFYIIFMAFTLVVTTNVSYFLGIAEYLSVALLQFFVISYFGQVLTNESEKLRDSLYECPWYVCNQKFKTTFQFLQFRLGEPVIIKAGGYFNISLDIFIAICKTSASYFAILRQVTEN